MDYSAPHQLVVEAQQCRAKMPGAGPSAVPPRLTVRGVSNNNQAMGRSTALCPRESEGIKQEPLPSPPAIPGPCPGPPVKKRRREDIKVTEKQLESGTTVKMEAEGAESPQQMVRFVTFEPGKWNQTFNHNRVKLPTPVLTVTQSLIIICLNILF